MEMKMEMKMMQYYHSNPLSLSNNTLLKKIDYYMVLTLLHACACATVNPKYRNVHYLSLAHRIVISPYTLIFVTNCAPVQFRAGSF